MTCAKRHVVAVLTGASGRTYTGTNACTRPQRACPRLPGEGYEKCSSICGQVAHAEVDALAQAGDDARGGSIRVGYDRVCDACAQALRAAGVAAVAVEDA